MPAQVDSGDTAWMLAATALVLLMTPALGLFYAGLVRARNTLNTYMMSVAALCVATIMWALVGYSIAFGDANGVIGGFDHLACEVVEGVRPRGAGRIGRTRAAVRPPERAAAVPDHDDALRALEPRREAPLRCDLGVVRRDRGHPHEIQPERGHHPRDGIGVQHCIRRAGHS